MEKLIQPKQSSSLNDIHPLIVWLVMALLIVHHHTFFWLSDHLTPYIQSEFKGSKAAENFSCRRTKTATIINCLGSHYQKELISDLRSTPFSVMLDGSNDTGLAKMFPVTVRVFYISFNRVMTKFLDMNVMEGKDVSTAAAMFKSVMIYSQNLIYTGNMLLALLWTIQILTKAGIIR